MRAELNAKVRWEIVKDFFFGLTLLESYDSEPLSGTADGTETARTDLTLTTTLGWSF